VYIVFGVFCFAMFCHVLLMFPETAGKSLEEFEGMFLDPKGRKYLGTPPWRTHVVKRTLDAEGNEKEKIHAGSEHDERALSTEDEEAGVLQPEPLETAV
jgi:hypothetical protein